MLSQAPAVHPPSSNTGGKIDPPVCIDWLSFTCPVDQVSAENLGLLVGEWFGGGCELVSRRGGFLGFAFSSDVSVPVDGQPLKVGIIAWGGASQGSRVYVSLPGSACSLIRDWAQVREDLETCHAKLTRVDLACDDIEGAYSVDLAAEWYRAGDFNAGGRMPSHSTHGGWLVPDGSGRTLYVGKSKNGKMLRVYEKGKQLGDAASPWVRWELQLGNRDRLIPLEVLTSTASYFAGGYSCLSKIVTVAATRIRTAQLLMVKGLERLTTYARRAYGQLVNVLLIHSHGDVQAVVNALLRRGIPASLSPAWLAGSASLDDAGNARLRP